MDAGRSDRVGQATGGTKLDNVARARAIYISMGGWQMSENMQCQMCGHWQGGDQTCEAFSGLHQDASGNYVRGIEIPYEIWN